MIKGGQNILSAFVYTKINKLLDDLELIADKRNRVVIVLSSCNDTHDHEYDESDIDSPSDERNECTDCAGDPKNKTVVNVILYIRIILLRFSQKTDETEDAEVSQNSVNLSVPCGCSRVVINNGALIVNVLVLHFLITSKENYKDIIP